MSVSRLRSALVVLACCLLAPTPVVAAPAKTSPLLGEWAVEVDHLPIPKEARPRSVTFSFAQERPGHWRTRVLIVAPDGSRRSMTSSAPVDGSETVPIAGDVLEADHAALKLVTDEVLVLALVKNGGPASTRIYTVDPDGGHMTETAVSVGNDGRSVLRTNLFTRIR